MKGIRCLHILQRSRTTARCQVITISTFSKSLKMGCLSIENEMGCPARGSEMPITAEIQVKTVDVEFTGR